MSNRNRVHDSQVQPNSRWCHRDLGELALLLIFVGLVCLFPLSFYFLFLASLHHRSRTTMIPGVWDRAALFLGLSGFLILGGTVLVFSLDRSIREYWLWGGTLREWLVLHRQAEWLSKSIWVGYVASLLVLIGWGLRSRRSDTVYYQTTPTELEDVVIQAARQLHLHLERRGAWYWLVPATGATPIVRSATTTQGPLLRVDGSESMRVAVLHWAEADSPCRDDLEAECCRLYREVPRGPSPTGVWFLTATGVIFMATAMLLGMVFFRIER